MTQQAVNIEDLPKRVICKQHVEIYETGDILILTSGMYKLMQGCIFGLSIQRVQEALRSGKMEIYNQQNQSK